jgi:hypothetical protein
MERLGVTTTKWAAPAVPSATASIFAQWSRHETHDVVRKARRLSTVTSGRPGAVGELTSVTVPAPPSGAVRPIGPDRARLWR